MLYRYVMTTSLKLNCTVLLYVLYAGDAQSNFVQTESLDLLRLSYRHLNATYHPHYCTVTFRSLPASEFLQHPHHCRHDRCLSGLWSGTTLR